MQVVCIKALTHLSHESSLSHGCSRIAFFSNKATKALAFIYMQVVCNKALTQ